MIEVVFALKSYEIRPSQYLIRLSRWYRQDLGRYQNTHPLGGDGWISLMEDACSLGGSPAEFAKQRETLKRHCEQAGRDESSIEKTAYDLVICARTEAALKRKIERVLPKGVEPWMAMIGTPSQVVDVVGEYERVGAEQLCMDFARNDPESYALFVEEVMRKL